MDSTVRARVREVLAQDFSTLSQDERIKFLRMRIRSGDLIITNNVRDILCAAGIEDFVILIGGPPKPRKECNCYGSLTSNWSSDPKHKPEWFFVGHPYLIRRIIKLGKGRAKRAMTNCTTEEEITMALYKEYLL